MPQADRGFEGVMEQVDRPRRPLVAVFGAPSDTGNLGVSALGESILQGVATRLSGARLLVFDNGRGRRREPADRGLPGHVRDGAWNSRRVHRAESLWAMRASARLGWPHNRNVDILRRADHVLDISGGDSFTDLYGPQRWQTVTLPKRITLRVGAPLTLLPQTFGPYRESAHRAAARQIIAEAEQAWARDEDSFEVLKDLLGQDFEPARHRQGVDVAFALAPRRPDTVPEPISSWLAEPGSAVGLNVSGLVMDTDRAREQFGLSVDYPALVTEVARRLLADGVDRLILVPHVRGGFAESDDRACDSVAERLGHDERVQVLPTGLDASETKWCISRLGWFCGTRMHSTIAGLSSGVPTAAIAYSPKTRGVFASCGVAAAVVDARRETTIDAIDQLIGQFRQRAEVAAVLADTAPDVVEAAHAQFGEILGQRATVGGIG